MNLRLLALLSLSHARGEKGKLLFTLIGIVLGVAIYTAITLASDTSRQSFENASALFETTTGAPVGSTVGRVPEQAISELLNREGVTQVIPLSTRLAPALAEELPLGTVRVVGTDLFGPNSFNRSRNNSTERERNREDSLSLFRHPPTALLSRSLTEALKGRNLSLVINNKPLPVRILGTIERELPEKVVLFDISLFQELFADFGEVDQIEVVATEEVLHHLPPPLQLLPPSDRAAQALRITEAFRLNLTFLSFISLLVTVLLIYNTVSYSVLQRRRELGILRALGSDRKTLFRLILLESFFLGAVGSLIGCAAGYALSFQMIEASTKTISTLYTEVLAPSPSLSPSRLLFVLLLGPLVSLLGALLPASEASSVEVRETFSLQTFETKFRTSLRFFELLSPVALSLCWLTSNEALLARNTSYGFLPPLFAVAGVLLLLPRTLLLLSHLKAGYVTSLAFDHIRLTLRRSAVAVGAMTIALGLVLGISVMIESFRGTVARWIDHIIAADIYISAGSTLPEEPISTLIALPEVELYDWITHRDLSLQGRKVRLQGTRFEALAARNRYSFLESVPPELLQRELADKESVFVSEPFSRRFQKKRGDELELPTLSGTVRLKITNVFQDYASDQGTVLLSYERYQTLFGDSRKNGLSLYLKPLSAEARTLFEERLAKEFPHLSFTNNTSLRAEVLRIFDQTFRLTYALQAIAVIIAALTILNTVLMLTLEREREFGVLRAIGASKRALIKVVSAEAFLLGLGASIGALALGGLLSVILVFVVNRHFFGWSIEYELHLTTVGGVLFGTLSLSTLAGCIPGWLLARRLGGESVRYE